MIRLIKLYFSTVERAFQRTNYLPELNKIFETEFRYPGTTLDLEKQQCFSNRIAHIIQAVIMQIPAPYEANIFEV